MPHATMTAPVTTVPTDADPATGRVDAVAEWRRPMTGITLGFLLFETVTGLAIYLLEFSVANQFGVLLHTVFGVLMTLPVGWYLGQHWWRRWRGNLNHYQLLGYVSFAAVLALTVSGFILTAQAWFGMRISYGWDLVHIVVSFVLIGGLGAHLVTLIFRRINQEAARQEIRKAYRICLVWTVSTSAGLSVLWAGLALGHRTPSINDAFPADYNFAYGIDRPFAPSLARKDMADVEGEMRMAILAALDPDQQASFLENMHVDPTQHVGVITVAEQVCGGMTLSGKQRERIAAAIEEARERFSNHGAIEAQHLAGSARCGTSGCHKEIYEEWLPSAHRYSAMDVVFQKVQDLMVQERDPQVTRYCAGCHDPISLFSGAKNVGNDTLSAEGSHEGISCVVCHSIVQTDVRGNADYTIRPPVRYIYETHEDGLARRVSDFLIRAYPREHVATYSRRLYKTAESCAACHKQYIDEEVNNFGWVQGQNQYDSWRTSRWHHKDDPDRTVSCRECHMPLADSTDPAAGDLDDPTRSEDDGKHRSHRFLGANQFIPLFHDLPGAKEHTELTVQWLQGKFAIPEIAEKWTDGPVVRLRLVVPETVRPGQQIEIQTVLTNNKTGHDFPTGPLDMIESWVELTVTDGQGRQVFHTGTLDDRGYLINPQIVFKKEGIDREGKLIDRHNLWDMVGARYVRTLFPGFTDTTRFVFPCPGLQADSAFPSRDGQRTTGRFTMTAPAESVDEILHVTAVLWYTKFSAPFMDRLFGEEAGMRAPATRIDEATAQIRVIRDATPPLH